jgi:hypothetical protein
LSLGCRLPEVSLTRAFDGLRVKENTPLCGDCERLFRDLIAANEEFDQLLVRVSEAARADASDYTSLRTQAYEAQIKLDRARVQLLEHRKEHTPGDDRTRCR